VALRKYLTGLLTITSLSLVSLYAQNENEFGSENINESMAGFAYPSNSFDSDSTTKETPISLSDFSSEDIKETSKGYPLTLSVDFDSIGDSKIRKGFFKDDEVKFAIAQAKANAIVYYCPAYSEGATIGVVYTYTSFHWDSNPWFNQQFFNTLSFRLGGFSKRLPRWFWQGLIGINIDANQWNLNEYATYDFILWGRYEYCRHIGVHIGLIAQTGMQLDRVYPILGADWQMSKQWKLNLVFPVNVSLEYLINDHWSIALAGRSFNSRQRIGPRHESQPKAVFRYDNTGAEVSVRYEKANMAVNVHVGSTLGGRFKVANRHNDHSHTYNLDSDAYAGAEAAIKF
jgi:hypothetical protein